MTAYLLDTNHASRLISPDHPLRRKVEMAQAAGDSFGLATPSMTETAFGYLMLPRAESNQREWERLRPGLYMYIVDEAVALAGAWLQVTLRRRGRQLATVDALIAAVAIRNELILLTNDGDFSAVPDLRIENWLPKKN